MAPGGQRPAVGQLGPLQAPPCAEMVGHGQDAHRPRGDNTSRWFPSALDLQGRFARGARDRPGRPANLTPRGDGGTGCGGIWWCSRRLLELFGCPRCGEALDPEDASDPELRGAVSPGSPLSGPGRVSRPVAARSPPTTRRRGPSRASATSGTPSTTCVTRTPVLRGLLPRPRHGVAARQDGARRRMRQGALHPLSRPPSRLARRPGRLERGGGGGPQPRILRQRPRGASPTSAPPRSSPAPSTWSCASGCCITSRIPVPGSGRLVRLLSPRGRILVYLYSRPARFGARRDGPGRLRRAALGDGAHPAPPAAPASSAPDRRLLYVGVVQLGAAGQRAGVGAAGPLAHGGLPGQALSQPLPRHLRPLQRPRRAPLPVGGPGAVVRRGGARRRRRPGRGRLVRPRPPRSRSGRIDHHAPCRDQRARSANSDDVRRGEGTPYWDFGGSVSSICVGVAGARRVETGPLAWGGRSTRYPSR